jgi:hypothetical protein
MNLILIYAGVGLLFGLIGVFVSLRNIREILRIQRTPTDVIGSLPPDGQVEVLGRAAQNTTTSPISRSPCAFWQVQVQENRSTGRSSHWVTIYQAASPGPFEISDGTGAVQISSAGADLILRDEINKSSGLFRPMEPDIQAALEELGIKLTGILGFQKTLRVHERIIQQGEEIYVLGEIQHAGGARTIQSVPDAPAIVSDRSERDTLGALYGRIVTSLLTFLFLGVLAVFAFLSTIH